MILFPPPLDGGLIGTISPGENGSGSKSNEDVLSVPQSSTTGASPSDTV